LPEIYAELLSNSSIIKKEEGPANE
jgi:hypothetical protein